MNTLQHIQYKSEISTSYVEIDIVYVEIHRSTKQHIIIGYQTECKTIKLFINPTQSATNERSKIIKDFNLILSEYEMCSYKISDKIKSPLLDLLVCICKRSVDNKQTDTGNNHSVVGELDCTSTIGNIDCIKDLELQPTVFAINYNYSVDKIENCIRS